MCSRENTGLIVSLLSRILRIFKYKPKSMNKYILISLIPLGFITDILEKVNKSQIIVI